MRAFNSALSSNLRRGASEEVNFGRDAADKTNKILLLSVISFTQLSTTYSYYAAIILAARSGQLIHQTL